jgi:hypothetical protein
MNLSNVQVDRQKVSVQNFIDKACRLAATKQMCESISLVTNLTSRYI